MYGVYLIDLLMLGLDDTAGILHLLQSFEGMVE